ncbi:MAG: hypothetical protein RL328_693 [Acidobacteriota bacterium]
MRILAALLLLAASAAAQTSPLFQQVGEMLNALSQITGWRVKRNIPSEILTREKFAAILAESVREAEKDKETRAVELTLKMFGLIPWDFRLAQESADLMEEQAAAFYDYQKKRLYVLESTPDGQEQRLALVHELAHALADQQFGIRKYLKGAKDDDAFTARQAVIEGQASWLSWAYLARSTTGRAEVPRSLVEELSRVGATGGGFPVLSQTPLYMRESLVFPYTEGMKFQDSIYRKLGAGAFERIFREAPLSSQEILHPEQYADKVIPTHPELPRPAAGVDWGRYRELARGDVGEFDYSVMLRQYAPGADGREIASHWRGARYRLLEHKATQAPLLLHSSEWDSPAAAGSFFRAYAEVLRRKFPQTEIRETGSEFTGHGESGDFSLRITGATVQAVEGVPDSRVPGPVKKR